MYRSLLLPLDGSSFAEEALPLASLLAATHGATVRVVHVIRPAPEVDFGTPEEDLAWRKRVREAASDALGEIVSGLRSEGVDAHAEVREGRVADALLESMEENGVDLVVLTSHGSGGFRRWWLGSVADSLLRRSRVPVLLVRPWDDTEDRKDAEPRFRTVLVPLDGSREAEEVLPHAQALQDESEGRMVLVQVVPSPLEVGTLYGVPSVRVEGDRHRDRREAARAYLEGVAEGLEGEVECRVVEASSGAEGILEAARVSGADLVALSTHGRGGLSRTILGSVADKVVRGAVVPVLAVRTA